MDFREYSQRVNFAMVEPEEPAYMLDVVNTPIPETKNSDLIELCSIPKMSTFAIACLIDKGKWYGDDYGFCKLWTDLGQRLWIIPNVTLTHSGSKVYEGNLHDHMVEEFKKEEASKNSDKAVRP